MSDFFTPEEPFCEEITYRDGFAGFLCAVDEALRRSPSSGRLPLIRAEENTAGLFDELHAIDTDLGRAGEFWARLRRVSTPAAKTCFAAFCSDRKDKERAVSRVIARILDEGHQALEDLGDADVADLLASSRRCLGEAHRFCGLVRFGELKDLGWYAPIRPDCDILPFIGDHFSNRFSGMPFIIHDSGRAKAILHEPGKPWKIALGFTRREASGQRLSLPLTEEELHVREDLRRYFNSIAIVPRRNLRLQAGHMPKKHWEYLPEMEDSQDHGLVLRDSLGSGSSLSGLFLQRFGNARQEGDSNQQIDAGGYQKNPLPSQGIPDQAR